MSLQRCFSLLWPPALALILTACIDQISFPNQQEQDLLVVDGKLTDGDGPHFLRLSRTSVVGRSANFPAVENAFISLEDDLGNVAFYLNTAEPGLYFLASPAIPRGLPGRTYRLSITLPNGALYESGPETMPEPVRADSASFTFDGIDQVDIYTHLQVPDAGEGPFLRFSVSRVYAVSEIFCGPFDPTFQCYVTEPPVVDQVFLLDAGVLADNVPVRHYIQSFTVNRTFGEPQYFNVETESLTRTAFQYWEKIDALLDQEGSIFDAPPGTVRGNVARAGNPDEVVLGYFYVTPADTVHKKAIPSDFAPLILNPYCGVPGFPPNPFLTECCNCLQLERSTLQQPEYWE